jgi:hypothetical protein
MQQADLSTASEKCVPVVQQSEMLAQLEKRVGTAIRE